MLCVPSVARLVARLCSPSAAFALGAGNGASDGGGLGAARAVPSYYVRVAPRLTPEHVAVLLAAAEMSFGGRVHATARALLDHAMQADFLGAGAWHCASPLSRPPGSSSASATASTNLHEDGESEYVLFRLQIAQLHLDWLQVLQAERGACGIDAVLRSVLAIYARMPRHERDMLVQALAQRGDVAPARPAKLYDPPPHDESVTEHCRHLLVDESVI